MKLFAYAINGVKKDWDMVTSKLSCGYVFSPSKNEAMGYALQKFWDNPENEGFNTDGKPVLIEIPTNLIKENFNLVENKNEDSGKTESSNGV